MNRLIFAFVFFISILNSQIKSNVTDNDTLAIVDGKIITIKDFISRFELMPYQGKEIKQTINEKKKEILYSIVAEKLFSNEVVKRNLNNDSMLQVQEKSLSNIFLRDALYKTLMPKVFSVTENEYYNNYKKYAEDVTIQILTFYTLKDANKFLKEIEKSNKPKDYLIKNENVLFVLTDTIVVTEGLFKKEYEDEIYNLDVNKFSKPFQSNGKGYFIVNVLKRNISKKIESISIFERRKWIENQIKTKKEDTLASNIFYDLLANQSAKSDSTIFQLLTKNILKLLLSDSSKEKLELSGNDYSRLRNLLNDFLNNPLISTSSGDITLTWTIEYLSAERIKFKSKNLDEVQSTINSALKLISQNHILAFLAKNKNLFMNEDYKKDISNWMDNYRYHYLLKIMKDSLILSNSEFAKMLISNSEILKTIPMSIRVTEIYTENDIYDLFLKVTNGVSFERLSEKNHRKEFNNGKSEIIHISKYPFIGAYSLTKNINEIVGPIINSNGFSIFKITEKYIPDSVKYNQAFIKLKEELIKNKFNNYIHNLSEEQNSIIFENKLEKINVSNIQMFTTRKIGFGGSIIAFPMVSPQHEWSKKLSNKNIVFP
ncbi:MAG: hypothetical protein EXR24_04650 [Ignavibacteria bacterium]|nr:hypothetical protein [Bacteroidota bacterium]MSQ46249.1 hypothetical protein [Ignavibacteria bacterium]